MKMTVMRIRGWRWWESWLMRDSTLPVQVQVCTQSVCSAVHPVQVCSQSGNPAASTALLSDARYIFVLEYNEQCTSQQHRNQNGNRGAPSCNPLNNLHFLLPTSTTLGMVSALHFSCQYISTWRWLDPHSNISQILSHPVWVDLNRRGYPADHPISKGQVGDNIYLLSNDQCPLDLWVWSLTNLIMGASFV